MNPFAKLEEAIFFGEIIRDFGVIEERRPFITRKRVSLLLCRKNHIYFLAIKESNIMPLGAGVRYVFINNPQIEKFRDAVDSAYRYYERERISTKPFRGVEEKAFLGEIIHDFGIIEERRKSLVRTRVSFLLCRKKNDFCFTIKESNIAPFGFNINYIFIYRPQMARFKDAVDEAYNIIAGSNKT